MLHSSGVKKLAVIACVLVIAVLIVPFSCDKEKIVDIPCCDDIDATLEERIGRTGQLGLDLYHQVKEPGENLMISPHSVAVCFGMAYAGARSHTEQEIADVLTFHHPQAGFHPALKELNDILTGRGTGLDPESFRLSIVNGAWGRQGMPCISEYTNLLLLYYGSAIEYMDFMTQAEESRLAINQWVEDRTEGKVEDLIPPGAIDDMTYLVLANTIYFKAQWKIPFDPAVTFDQDFTLLDGTVIRVPVMSGMEEFGFAVGTGYKAVSVPYVGEEVSMLMIMPDAGNFEAFEAALTAERIDEISASLYPEQILLAFPKFSFVSQYDLKPVLQDMGMVDAFAPGADFSGMDGIDDGSPFISFVVHKTFISVDEYGTEAAAATGMGLALTSLPREFIAVRPFIFVIRDNETGTVLFLGRVVDPR